MERSAEGFFRHRALILAAAGGAVAEAGLLTAFAPAARPVAPQVTALPALAAYHDLRWLFTDGQSWFGFTGVLLVVLVARAAADTLLLRLAWPSGQARPRAGRAFWSCLLLTALAWVLLSPVATLVFGVAVLPFSWPFLAALPIMIGMLLVLSHGGILTSWWRRLPPPRAVLWLLGSFVALSFAAGVTSYLGTGPLDTAGALAVAATAGLVNARAWYVMAGVAARLPTREHVSVPAKVLLGFPYAPIAALMVLALVVGVARLMFTGTIQVGGTGQATVAAAAAGTTLAGSASTVAGSGGTVLGNGGGVSRDRSVEGAVLVVAGWGSSCCNAANALRAVTPGTVVRQFSYEGLSASGQPLPNGPDDDDVPLPELGDRMAAQVMALHALTHGPVDIVAESEGTLGVYAMLDRHPGLPVGAVALLSPIIEPGQLGYVSDSDGVPVPEYALNELNVLVGTMSPYGPNGAAELLSSVGEFGARYFEHVVTSDGTGIRWLAVVPLADALTLNCGLPPTPDVVVVSAFHGGLLGDRSVLPMVSAFLGGRTVDPPPPQEEDSLRAEADLISGAASAWRMPQTSQACP